MIAGATRIVEIAIILRDQANAGDDEVLSFQYIPPFVSTSIIIALLNNSSF
jgi:hypothetical protein